MAVCPSCGRENPDDARFCNACGATLGVDDITNFLDLDLLEGCLLARDGRFEDALIGQLAEIFALTKKPDVAREHASRSLAIAERKGDVARRPRSRAADSGGRRGRLIAVAGRC